MIRPHFLRTTLVPGLAATALALAAAAGVAGAAQADPLCLPTQQCSSGSPTPTDPSSGSPAPTAEPSKAPAPAPAPTVAPAPPVAPAPAAPTAAAAPTASATERMTASPSATARSTAVAASATPSRSDSGPTAESNWNKPIEKPEKASHAAAVSASDDGPDGYLGVFAIMGGVLLVGFAGLVFALWSRNRLAGHW